ncbi:MAG TPA: hypothetical protein PK760_06855, partial [Flavobacteriales bacterium]|nr:hypothetical protein [Flavobacteriales bacterium]
NTFQRIMQCDGCTSRTRFIKNTVMLALGKTVIDLQVMALRPDLATDWSWCYAWLNPFHLVGPWLEGKVAFIVCLTTFLFFAALVWNAVHLARDAGWNHWLGAVTAIPFVGLPFAILLATIPERKHTVWDLI